MRKLLSFAVVLLIFPIMVSAQAGGLVPCGGDASDPCTTEDVGAFANGIIEFLISMLGVIAVIVLVYAGFQLVTSGGDEAKWTSAKNLFTNVIIGIIIILAAWLIVDTVLKGLTGSGLNYWGILGGSGAPSTCVGTGPC